MLILPASSPGYDNNAANHQQHSENTLQAKRFTKYHVAQKGSQSDAEADEGIGLRYVDTPQYTEPDNGADTVKSEAADNAGRK